MDEQDTNWAPDWQMVANGVIWGTAAKYSFEPKMYFPHLNAIKK